ncbi:MAG TPA: hypothetical protein VEC12_06530, partial [Bacteroidia bacterium]|nr:hypothetical protein [Bacteroidia bacterium]
MKYSLLLIFSSVCFSLLSQECKWLSYNKNTGTETGRAICTDNNNHVIMAGHYGAPFVLDTFNFNSPTALLVKYNDTGGVIWAAHAIGHCHFSDVEADAANNIYVTGYITGTVDFGNGVKITLPPSVQRSVLVKYNPNGMAQWVNVLSSSSGSGVVETKITVDTENNIIAGFPFNGSVSFQGTGKTLNSAGATDIGIVKYSSSGVYLNSVRFGGVSADNFVELDNDDDDNIYILGNTRSGFTFGQQTLNAGNVIVLKTDSAFSPVTSRGITGDLIDESGISVRNNGEFVITGRVKGTVDFGGKIIAVPNQYCSTRRSYIVYYNEDFTARWIRTDEPVTCGFVDPIGGIFYRDNFIYGGGFLTCSARFGIHITTDPGFNNALYFYKMDTLGNFLWVFASPGAVIGGSFLTDIRADQESDIVFTGYYTDSITVFNKKAINTDHNDHFFAGKIADYNIFRGYVSPGPYCAGDTFIIPYSKKGKFKPGNEFIAQLSDSAGNFDGDERELGRVKDTSGGYIYGKLPLFNVATTNKYRIRIVSTNPSVESFYKFDTLRLLIYSKDTANAGPDISFCRGGSVTLTTTGGSKWHWWPHHGVVKAKDTANRHIQVRPDSTVEYRIIISDSSGCGVTDTDYVKVTVWLRLSVNVADTHYYCAGTTPVVEALINGGIYGATSIKWYDAGDPAKKTLSDSAKLVASPAPHKTYRVVVRDSCSADSTLITVIETAPLLVTVNADTTICAGGTVQVRAAAAGGNTSSHNILWTINNGTWTSGNFAENVTPLITTIYTAKLTDGCSAKPDSAQITVTVRPPLKVTVNTDTTICMGQTVQLRAMLQGGYIPQRTVQWTTEKGTAISSDTIELVNPL